MQSIKESIIQAISSVERQFKEPQVGTGTRLDGLVGGWEDPDLIVLAGRPEHGRTTVAMNVAASLAQADHNILFFSLQLNGRQLARRLLARGSQVPTKNLRHPVDLTMDEFERVVIEASARTQMPFYWADGRQTAHSITEQACAFHKKVGPVRLVVVDGIYELGDGQFESYEERSLFLAGQMRALKDLALALECPVMVTAPLGRTDRNRDRFSSIEADIADLMFPSSIEPLADIILTVFREELVLARAEPARRPDESEERYDTRYDAWRDRLLQIMNTVEIRAQQNRHGSQGMCRLAFFGKTSEVGDLVEGDND